MTARKTYLVKIVDIDYETNGPDQPPCFITRSMDGKGLMIRVDVGALLTACPRRS